MTSDVLDRYRTGALAWANDIREKLGLPPQQALIPGIPRSSCDCPLARTIAADVDDLHIQVSHSAIWIDGTGRACFDHDTTCFVRSFDSRPHGYYPDLVAPEGRFVR